MRDSSPREVPAAAVAPGPFPGCGRYSGQKPAVSLPEQASLRRSLRTGSEDGRSPAHPAPQEPPPSRILRPRIQPFSAAPGHTYAAHQRSPPLPSTPPHGFSRFLRAFAHGTSKASAHDAAERTQKEQPEPFSVRICPGPPAAPQRLAELRKLMTPPQRAKNPGHKEVPARNSARGLFIEVQRKSGRYAAAASFLLCSMLRSSRNTSSSATPTRRQSQGFVLTKPATR